jgi:hypothetical protein
MTDPVPSPEVLQSPLLDLPGRVHGFTTRRGGVSEGVFSSLNFSPKWPEEREAVARNHRLLADHLGYDPHRLYRVFQVHGREGVHVTGQPVEQVYAHRADFLVTGQPGVTLGVITADCVSALIADPTRPAVAAVHAGWRGLAAGVLEAAVSALRQRLGSRPADLRAALGPSIGPCCFEVGPEVVDAFAAAFPGESGLAGRPAQRAANAGDAPGDERPHVDLWTAARLALQRAGLAPEHIDTPPGCTHCDARRYHSYRRDGPRVGQHLSVVGISATPG